MVDHGAFDYFIFINIIGNTRCSTGIDGDNDVGFALCDDGEELPGETIAMREQNQTAGKLIKKVLSGFPANVMEIQRVGELTYDKHSRKCIISVMPSINREKYQTFIEKLIPVLENTTTKTRRIAIKNVIRLPDWSFPIRGIKGYRGSMFAVCIQLNEHETASSIWQRFQVSEDVMQAAISASKKNRQKLIFDIVGTCGDIVSSETHNSPWKTFSFVDMPYRFIGIDTKISFDFSPMFFVFPFFSSSLLIHTRDLFTLYSSSELSEHSKTTIELKYEMFPGEFKRIRDVVCRIE